MELASGKKSPGKTAWDSNPFPKSKAICWKSFGERTTSFVDYGIGPKLV